MSSLKAPGYELLVGVHGADAEHCAIPQQANTPAYPRRQSRMLKKDQHRVVMCSVMKLQLQVFTCDARFADLTCTSALRPQSLTTVMAVAPHPLAGPSLI
eukprot:TRINITY_DN16627_c0_g4_i2.p1 TRINITY_DN16627_c0_g4~~TRINITY_DN16627_c0_g4_i2.p1  ORF type:complete len:100 (-),score=6.04 TRINITY_DN16627_c0_g4_i2:132-431(-)